MTDLNLSAAENNYAYGINNNGQAVGFIGYGAYDAFLYSDGVMTNLGFLCPTNGGCSHIAYDINDNGQVVGSTIIPIPAAIWLFSSGLIGLIAFAWRR